MASATRTRLIKFETRQIIRRSRQATAQAFRTVADEMTEDIRSRIDTPYPPASRPGGFPHQRSGNLERKTKVVPKGRSMVVRTPQYGIWLEGGTGKMRARPFIRRRIHNRRRHWVNRINDEIRKNVGE